MTGGLAGQDARATPVRRRKWPWVVLFFVAGLVLVVALLLTAVAPAANWPWLLGSALLVGVAGYEIWRADHPGESARRQITRRISSAVAFLAVLILGSVLADHPVEALVLIGAVVGAAFVVALLIARPSAPQPK